MNSLVLPIVCAVTVAAAAQEALSPLQVQEAIALGKSCGDVPILRITKPDGDFIVFIEDPFARIAVRVLLQSRSGSPTHGTIQPMGGRRAQLTAGALPAHGIITGVRWRGWEWTFDRLPSGEFDVVVQTTAGVQRYRVTSEDRTGRIRVCT